MNCWHCERPAHGVCKFCGRAVCRDHAKTKPSVISIYSDGSLKKALTVADTLWCGVCKPGNDPIDLDL